MAHSVEKRGFIEKGANFFEKVHFGIGGVALAGALIAPPELAAPLITIGALEIAHGAIVNYLKNRIFKKNKAAHASGRLALSSA